MSKVLFITLALGLALIATVSAHGRMIYPVNRQSLWRYYPGYPRYSFDTQWCGVMKRGKFLNNKDVQARNVTCGIAGPIYNNKLNGPSPVYLEEYKENKNLYSYEYGSSRYTGDIRETFKAGQTYDFKTHVSDLLISI